MDIQSLMQDRRVQLGLVGAISFGVGFAVGRITAVTKEEIILPEDNSPDMDGMLEILKSEGYSVEGEEIEELTTVELLKFGSDEPIAEIVVEAETTVEERVVENVFASSGDNWDYAKELGHRTPDKPYIVHRDEFMEGESGFDQHTLTYFEGDNILVDAQEIPINKHAKIIGYDDDIPFGHGSGDKKVVYIRNESLRAEYEILHSPDHYTSAVLGHEIESEFERMDEEREKRPKKFRDND